jgi:hypothetical protein
MNKSLQQKLDELMELEEDHLVEGFNQVVEKKDRRHGTIATSTQNL